MDVEKIEEDGMLLALVIRARFSNPGLNFFTPEAFPFQLGIHLRKKNEFVKPHQHSPFKALNIPAQEFFYLEKGKVEIEVFADKKSIKKTILEKGDMMLLNCGHSIRFLEDSKLIELKQGPYRGRDEEKRSI